MELWLNLAWVFCSLGLIWFWVWNLRLERVPLRTQVFALAMIVLLLLPVISLSDDLIALQGLAETDMSLRRALHVDEWHASSLPGHLALPEREFGPLLLGLVSRETPQDIRPVIRPTLKSKAHDIRPPPAA